MFFNFLKLRQNNKAITLIKFNLILAIWLGLILNFGFFKRINQLTPYQGVKSILFLGATLIVVVAAYNFLLQLINWKWTAKVFAAVFIIVGGLSSYFVNSLGVVITPDQIQNMLQTDVREVKDLWSLHLIIWAIFFIIIPLIVLKILKIEKETFGERMLKKSLSIAGSLIVVAALLFCFYIDYAAIFREHRDLKGMLSPQNTIASTLSYFRSKSPKEKLPLIHYGEDAHIAQKTGSSQHPKLMVLVIGETARAESFSLNGYQKNTNPELSKLNIINFNQVSSCGTATAVSVPCMFSGMTRKDYDEQLASHREGLLDIAKRAGYKVTWIDNNSGCKGACDRVEQYQIPQPLKQKWCDESGECLDEILVDSLQDYLKNIKKDDTSSHLIVLHQVGSHGPAYYKRSRSPYQPFQPMCNTNAIQGCDLAELHNSYDNSIVYTDHVLSQVIDLLKQHSEYQTGFWYLSDHGESTGEHGLYLHGAPYSMAPVQQTHIPMLMWFSDEWKSNNKQQIACLSAQSNHKLSQDNLFPSLLSLLDIRTQVIASQNDMLSDCR